MSIFGKAFLSSFLSSQWCRKFMCVCSLFAKGFIIALGWIEYWSIWSTFKFHFEFNQDAATQLHPQCKLYIYSFLTIQYKKCVHSIYAWMLEVFYCSQILVYVMWVWSHITLCIAPLWEDWMCRCLSFWCALVEWILESHGSRRDERLQYFMDQMWKNLCKTLSWRFGCRF